jgi:hypothetical protein
MLKTDNELIADFIANGGKITKFPTANASAAGYHSYKNESTSKPAKRGRPAGSPSPNALEPRLAPHKAEILKDHDELLAAKRKGVFPQLARKWGCSEVPLRQLVKKWKTELAEGQPIGTVTRNPVPGFTQTPS